MAFCIGPQRFDRIQFRCIGREVFDLQIGNCLQIVGHRIRAMDRQAVPDQDDGPTEMPAHLSKDRHDHRVIDRVARLQKVVATESSPPRRDGQDADRRDSRVMHEPVRQLRRLSARRPCPLHQRHHQKAAFVPKGQHGVQTTDFFLIRGQSARTQRSISASSRSRARRSGFCRVQPSDLSKVGT